MRPQKHVLTCINEPDISRFVSSCLQNGFVEQYELAIREAHSIDKLLAIGECAPPDLFILLLNNMFYSYSHKFLWRGENRVEHLLDILTRLKQACHKPVIAMTGWPLSLETWNEENTKQAGASFLFSLPLEGGQLRDAARQCLEQQEVVLGRTKCDQDTFYHTRSLFGRAEA